MKAQRRVMLYVQHLLGIGHLQRSAIVARACADAGLDVVLVSGGYPVPDLPLGEARFEQLPPCVADRSELQSADGRRGTAGGRRLEGAPARAAARAVACVQSARPGGRAVSLRPSPDALRAAAAAGARRRPPPSAR